MSSHKQPGLGTILFKPQLNLSMEPFSIIGRSILRTIAMIFAQAGLISSTHPALQFTVPDELRWRFGFRGLMGEAFYTLRTTAATPYQWGTYLSVVAMMFVMIGGAVGGMTIAGFGLGQKAYAQIFVLPGRDTSATAASPGMPNWGAACADPTAPAAGPAGGMATPPPAPAGAAGMMDNCIPTDPTSGHSDYGIMLLNKVLRQGMIGQGAPLQNALRPLFFLYNTALSLIAGIILFWLVLSVVVDTARTGKIGGGRHNMVWAPIRIIFALGMMLPLGNTVGFSTGQFIVTKVAEWGSNLGSNLWSAYGAGVANYYAFARNPQSRNTSEIVKAYTNMWVCRVAHNSWTWATTRTPTSPGRFLYPFGDPAALPHEVSMRAFAASVHPVGKWSIHFQASSGGTSCGTLQLPDFSTSPAVRSFNNMAGIGGGAFTLAGVPPQYRMATATMAMQIQTAQAVSNLFFPCVGGVPCTTFDDFVTNSAMGYMARMWACDFVAQYIYDSVNGSPVSRAVYSDPQVGGTTRFVCPSRGPGDAAESTARLSAGATPTTPIFATLGPAIVTSGFTTYGSPAAVPTGGCGGFANSGAGNGQPNDICIAAMIDLMTRTNNATIRANMPIVLAQLQGWMAPAGGGSMAWRGWADMGRFLMMMGQIESAMSIAEVPPVEVQPGDWVPGGTMSLVGFQQGVIDNYTQKMTEIRDALGNWWEKQSASDTYTAPVGVAADGLPAQGAHHTLRVEVRRFNAQTRAPDLNPVPEDNSTSWWGRRWNDIKSMGNWVVGAVNTVLDAPFDIIAWITKQFVGDLRTGFIELVSLDDPNMHPLAQVVQIGSTWFTIMIRVISGIAMAAAAASFFVPGIAVLTALSTIMPPLFTVLILSGLLKFVVPFIPVFRVMMAAFGWIVSVFEAVVMLPIAALSHLSTEGEGLAPGSQAKQAWLQWFMVMMRPSFIVMGFVGAMLVSAAMVSYANAIINESIMSMIPSEGGLEALFGGLFGMMIYIVVIFTIIQASFKLTDSIPNAGARWIGAQIANEYESEAMEAMFLNKGLGMMGGLARAGGGGVANFASSVGTIGQGVGAGGRAGFGAAKAGLAKLSDMRLKENIVLLGQEKGFNIYAFNYIDDDRRHVGVMAHEVKQKRPDAVSIRNGYLTVHYERLGLEMRDITHNA